MKQIEFLPIISVLNLKEIQKPIASSIVYLINSNLNCDKQKPSTFRAMKRMRTLYLFILIACWEITRIALRSSVKMLACDWNSCYTWCCFYSRQQQKSVCAVIQGIPRTRQQQQWKWHTRYTSCALVFTIYQMNWRCQDKVINKKINDIPRLWNKTENWERKKLISDILIHTMRHIIDAIQISVTLFIVHVLTLAFHNFERIRFVE